MAIFCDVEVSDDIFGLVDAFSDDEVPGALEKDADRTRATTHSIDTTATDAEGEDMTPTVSDASDEENASDLRQVCQATTVCESCQSREVEQREHDFLDIKSGLSMRYELRGPEDAPKLLYIPGATDDLRKSSTMGHLNAFAQHFRTLTCDLRNQGKTTPATLDKYVPQAVHVEDLVALVDGIFGPEETVHVVGWSVGAVLGLAFARTYPGRVKRLVVLSGGYMEPQASFPRPDLHLPATHSDFVDSGIEGVVFGPDWPWVRDICSYDTLNVEERCSRMLIHADQRRKDGQHDSEESVPFEDLLHMYVHSEDMSVMHSPHDLGRGVMLSMMACFKEGTVGVENICTPTLILHGRHDGMYVPSRAQDLRCRMPAAELWVLEDEGHVLVHAAMPHVADFLGREQPLPAPPLTLNRATALLDELTREYKRAAFQKALAVAALDAMKVKSTRRSLLQDSDRWRKQVCLPVQIPVVERFGFEPTVDGVRASEEQLRKFMKEPHIRESKARIQALLEVRVCPSEALMPPMTFADLSATRGIHMRYDLKGPEDAPKLLYIPGVTDDLRKPLSIANSGAFAGQFRTLTCDLRNQGLTTPFDLDKYVNMQTYIDDLVALMDHVWGPASSAHVVGWSFGSVLALSLARTHSHRLNGVVLISAGYWKPQPGQLEVAPRPGLVTNSPDIFANDWQWIRDVSSYSSLKLNERCRRTLIHADTRRKDQEFVGGMHIAFPTMMEMFVRTENDSVMKKLEDVEQLGLGVLAQESCQFLEGTPDVDRIKQHTMIINGRHDGMHPVYRAEDLSKRMKCAVLEILEDCGHIIVRDAAVMAIPFLVRLSRERKLDLSSSLALLAEMICALSKEDFQKSVHGVFLADLTSLQSKIIERYGFEPTLLGMEECWKAIECFSGYPGVAERMAHVESLQKPSAERRCWSPDW